MRKYFLVETNAYKWFKDFVTFDFFLLRYQNLRISNVFVPRFHNSQKLFE